MKQQATLAAGPAGAPLESDFIRVLATVPLPVQVMSNIDHTCGQY